jgi:RNAse (barnase) inhibitor barstar
MKMRKIMFYTSSYVHRKFKQKVEFDGYSAHSLRNTWDEISVEVGL